MVFVAAGEGSDVWLGADAVLEDRIERDRRFALHGYALAAHLADQAEDIQYRQVEAITGEHAEAREKRLVFKLKGPT